MKTTICIILLVTVSAFAQKGKSVTQISSGNNSPNINGADKVVVAPDGKPAVTAAPTGAITLTTDEKLNLSLIQRSILATKSDQDDAKDRYTQDSAKIQSLNAQLNEEISKAKAAHKDIGKDYTFDQESLSFVKPPPTKPEPEKK